jgi:tetratricopeptide (TPR) repeat protein
LLCSQFGSDGVIFCSICFTCQILPPSRYSVALPNLLSTGEKALFAQLAVFVGDFTLEAAESVVERSLLADAANAFDLLDGLTGLVDQNMLRSATPNPFNDDPRFRMLLILREFALEELDRRGERSLLARRHADYYVTLAETGAHQLHGPQQVLWLEYLEAEIENLRAALTWSLTHQEVEIAARLAIALGWFWTIRGHLFEGQDWLNRLLALPESCDYPHLRAEALIAVARIAHFRGDYAGQERLAAESLDLCRSHALEKTLPHAIYHLGLSHLYRHNYAKAEDLLNDALVRFRQLGDRYSVATALAALSILHGYYQQFTLARSYIEESMALYRTVGDTDGIASALLYMATLAYDEGDYENSQILFERCLPLYQTLGNKHAIALAHVNLASLAMVKDESQRARTYAEKALPVLEEMGERWQPPRLKRIFAYLALKENDIEQARVLCQESFLSNQELGDQRGMIAAVIGFAHIALLQQDLLTAARLIHGARLHLVSSRLSLLANDLYAYEQAQHTLEAHLAPHTRLALATETEVIPLKELIAPFLKGIAPLQR